MGAGKYFRAVFRRLCRRDWISPKAGQDPIVFSPMLGGGVRAPRALPIAGFPVLPHRVTFPYSSTLSGHIFVVLFTI